GGSFILLGVAFRAQLEQVLAAVASLGGSALGLVAALSLIYIGYQYFRRRRIQQKVRLAGMTVEELHRKQKAGEDLRLIDLRPQTELDREPFLIRGALRMSVEDVQRRKSEFPRDRDIVFYCSCPHDWASVQMVLLLNRNGIVRARPLRGGIAAWRERNFEMENHAVAVAKTAAPRGCLASCGKTTGRHTKVPLSSQSGVGSPPRMGVKSSLQAIPQPCPLRGVAARRRRPLAPFLIAAPPIFG